MVLIFGGAAVKSHKIFTFLWLLESWPPWETIDEKFSPREFPAVLNYLSLVKRVIFIDESQFYLVDNLGKINQMMENKEVDIERFYFFHTEITSDKNYKCNLTVLDETLRDAIVLFGVFIKLIFLQINHRQRAN